MQMRAGARARGGDSRTSSLVLHGSFIKAVSVTYLASYIIGSAAIALIREFLRCGMVGRSRREASRTAVRSW